MEKIVDNIGLYLKDPEKHEKFEYEEEKSQIVNNPKRKKYDYYICDYCKSEIKIEKDSSKMTGGIVNIPQTLSKTNRTVKLALCNKCVNPVIKQFEEKNMIEDNLKHIPYID